MLLLVNCLLLLLFLCFIFVFGPCFVVQYLVAFLVLQSSRWGRERWLLKNAFNVMGLFVLYVSSSLCNGLVCSVWLVISWPYSTDFLCDFEQLKYKMSTLLVTPA